MADEKKCPACDAANPTQSLFCGQCGARLEETQLTSEAIRRAVEEHLDHWLEDRDVVEYMVAEAAGSRVMTWAKLLAFFAGILVMVLVTVLGYLSFDLKSRIAEQAKTVEANDKKINEIGTKINADAGAVVVMTQNLRKVKPALDFVTAHAQDLRSQFDSTAKVIAQMQQQITVAQQTANDAKKTAERLSSGLFHDCPPAGDGGDAFVNSLKNRDIAPMQYEDETLTHFLADRPDDLEKMAKKHRAEWDNNVLAAAAEQERRRVGV